MDKARIDAVYDWADKNRKKYQQSYQETGSSSALRTFERYDDICDICAAAEKQVIEEDVFRDRMRCSQRGIIEWFMDTKNVEPGKTFTHEEVADMMRRMLV